jgi:hypothetical protein
MKDFYTYHPRSTMSLGSSFLPNDLGAAKLPAFTFNTKRSEGGASETTFQASLVRRSSELRDTLNIDTSFEASYLSFSGNSSFKYESSSLFQSNSLTLVVSAMTDYGLSWVDGPQLNPSAQRLIDTNKMKEFAQRHGSHYVTRVKLGAAVHAIVTLFELSEESRQAISVDTGGTGGWGPLKMSGRMTFNKEWEKATAEKREAIQVLATGGTGFTALGGLVETIGSGTGGIEKTQEVLKKYLEQFTRDNSAATGFWPASMTDFGWEATGDELWTIFREQRLLDLVDRFRSVNERRQQLEMYRGPNAPFGINLSPTEKETVEKASESYDKTLGELAALHRKWKADVKSDGTDWKVPPDKLPPLDEILPAHPLKKVQIELKELALASCKHCEEPVGPNFVVTVRAKAFQGATGDARQFDGELQPDVAKELPVTGPTQHYLLGKTIFIPVHEGDSVIRVSIDLSSYNKDATRGFGTANAEFNIQLERHRAGWTVEPASQSPALRGTWNGQIWWEGNVDYRVQLMY